MVASAKHIVAEDLASAGRDALGPTDAESTSAAELLRGAESARRKGCIGEAIALAERALVRASGDTAETALAQLEPSLAVTISIGVAVADATESLMGLMKTADARLYAAKRGGRNRVVSAG
jgi:diguanylate cyclase (GGDEF)-like protein